MSMKKLSKKLLAVVAAGAMTMGLAMPAFAGDVPEDLSKRAEKAYVSKTYQTEVKKRWHLTLLQHRLQLQIEKI